VSPTGFLLAAGFGTRLRPLTESRPKPLVPVCGVPMLRYALAWLRHEGIERAVVNAHYLAEQVLHYAGTQEGVHVTVVTEATILGTGGGLRDARDELSDPFVVMNTDVLHRIPLQPLLEAAHPAALTLRIYPTIERPYGHVSANADGTLVELGNTAPSLATEATPRDTHFAGVHALRQEVLDALPPQGEACIVRDAYAPLLATCTLRGVRYDGPWIDVGNLALYLQANLAVLKGQFEHPLAPHARASWSSRATPTTAAPCAVQGDAWIGKGAQVHPSVTLTDTVVGPGARIGEGTQLTRCVVWDGVQVPPGPFVDTVFHDRGAAGLG